MEKITFSAQEKADLIARIQAYFADELDYEIGNIPAEMLLNFFATEIGGAFYNRGLYDAAAIISDRIETIQDDIFALEKPLSDND